MSLPPIHHDITYSKAVLAGAWTEGLLFGLNIAQYIYCARMLIRESPSTRRRVLLGLASLQLLISAGHFASTLPYLFNGFLVHATEPGGPEAYYADPATPNAIAQFFFWLTNFIMGDSIMAWRCYVVWGHNLRLAGLFAVLVAALIASGYSGLAHIALLSKTQAIFAIENWTIATFSLSLATQAIATSMIVLKLWWYSPRQVPAMHRQYVSVMLVIIESGVILTAITAVDLSLFTLHKNAGAMLEPIMSQLSCLVPTSIIVRAGMKHNAAMKASSPLRGFNGNNILLVQTPPAGQASAGTDSIQSSDGTYIISTGDSKVLDVTSTC